MKCCMAASFRYWKPLLHFGLRVVEGGLHGWSGGTSKKALTVMRMFLIEDKIRSFDSSGFSSEGTLIYASAAPHQVVLLVK